MNVKRLKLIRNSLDKIPSNVAFNLKVWSEDYVFFVGDNSPSLIEYSNDGRSKFDANQCGTVCCAIGWACQDPEVNKEGLALNSTGIYPTFDGKDTWDAVISFLECEKSEAHWLFLADDYECENRTSLDEVKARIDDVIKSLS